MAVFVVIFDMALLGVLVADTEQVITAPVVETILLFNPADIYRLLNLTGYEIQPCMPAWQV